MPIIRGGGQFAVLRGAGGLRKGIACAHAIADPPGGQARGPPAFGHPRPGAVLHRLGERIGRGIIVFDVIGPGDLGAPFGPCTQRKLGVDPVEQRLGPGRIVSLDAGIDRGGNRGGHGAIVGIARANPFGPGRQVDQSAGLRQRRQHGGAALLRQQADLFHLRQGRSLGQPGVQGIKLDLGRGRGQEIFGQGHLMQRAILPLGKHVLHLGPIGPINRAEQVTVIGPVVLAQQAGHIAAIGPVAEIIDRRAVSLRRHGKGSKAARQAKSQ